MSTIFGVLKKEHSNVHVGYNKLGELKLNNQHIILDEDEDLFEKVFIQFNGGGGRWINPIADLLPDDTKVWALDNTSQGIYTIKDLKEIMI